MNKSGYTSLLNRERLDYNKLIGTTGFSSLQCLPLFTNAASGGVGLVNVKTCKLSRAKSPWSKAPGQPGHKQPICDNCLYVELHSAEVWDFSDPELG